MKVSTILSQQKCQSAMNSLNLLKIVQTVFCGRPLCAMFAHLDCQALKQRVWLLRSTTIKVPVGKSARRAPEKEPFCGLKLEANRILPINVSKISRSLSKTYVSLHVNVG